MFYLDINRTRYMFEPIDGCSFGCSYCNAFTGQADIKRWQDWVNPKIHMVNPEYVLSEFKALDKEPPIKLDFVFVCSTSDPFQNRSTEKVVHESLEILNNSIGLNTRLLSKGVIPKWLKDYKHNAVGMTIDNAERLYRAKAVGNIETFKMLSDNGIYTFLSIQPYDFSISISELKRFLNEIKFVNQITFGVLDDFPKKDFGVAFEISDIIAEFCIDNKINYFNGSRRFVLANRKRLSNIGITNQIWFGDDISVPV